MHWGGYPVSKTEDSTDYLDKRQRVQEIRSIKKIKSSSTQLKVYPDPDDNELSP